MRNTLLLGLVLALAACAPAAPVSPLRVTTDPLWNSNRELEPPGSLPPGFLTNHPFPPATGTLATTRVR